jgi:hypothetical protein
MNIKSNANKIHNDMLSKFGDENVKVRAEETFNSMFGNYVEFSITNENKLLKFIISKKDLNNSIFTWRYYDNPNSEKISLVERSSSVDTLLNDIVDIFEKNRFSEDYIKNIKNN